MIKILIFGSCVSRDPFDSYISSCTNSNSDEIVIVDYYARSSFASLFFPPYLHPLDLSPIKSPFRRKMVERDIRKSFLTDIQSTDYDFIIFDFTDDRFNLLKIADTFVTLSDEFRESSYVFSGDQPIIKSFSNQFFDYWTRGWDLLYKLIKVHSSCHKIIINDVKWALYDDDGVFFDNSEYILKGNEWLSRIYTHLFDYIPKNQFVDYGEIPFIGSANHKWGRSPFHLNKFFEDRLIECISNKAKSRDCSMASSTLL